MENSKKGKKKQNDILPSRINNGKIGLTLQ